MIYFLSETPTQTQQKQWIKRRTMWTGKTIQKDIRFEHENRTQKKKIEQEVKNNYGPPILEKMGKSYLEANAEMDKTTWHSIPYFFDIYKNLNAPQSDIYPHNVPDFDLDVINHVNEGIHS